jgi:hypothetical protein
MIERPDLTDDQLHEMRRVDNPVTKRPAKLNHTHELEADYRAWLAAECQHPNVEILCNVLKNGAKQVREQCVQCGKHFGTPLPHAKIADIDKLRRGTVEHHSEYEAARREELRQIKMRHWSLQFRSGWGSVEYQEYLKSDKWKQKRDAVMRRAHGICEGCGMQNATVVHHLHYHNIYEEWLWELVALCRPCHDQSHPEHRAGDD